MAMQDKGYGVHGIVIFLQLLAYVLNRFAFAVPKLCGTLSPLLHPSSLILKLSFAVFTAKAVSSPILFTRIL